MAASVKRQPTAATRAVVWEGQLTWTEADKPLSVTCSASSTCKEDELASDKWPSALHLQIIPYSVVNAIGSQHFRQYKSVCFHPEDAETLAKALGAGSAGCVHFTGAPECRLLILLYNSVKQAFLGFVPTDQELFVHRFLEVILLQNRQMREPLPEVVWEGELHWRDKAEGERTAACSVTSAAKEAGLGTEHWPKRLEMLLVPLPVVNSIDRQYFRNARTVCFLPGEEAGSALSTALGGAGSGSAGCVQFAGQCEVKVMIVLHKNDKTFIGYIPNDQVAFMDTLRDALRKARVGSGGKLKEGLVKSPAATTENADQQLERVREHFECPVCYKEMQDVQIFCCSNDHWICSVCLRDTRITICPQCREDFGTNAPKRCYTAERIVQQIRL